MKAKELMQGNWVHTIQGYEQLIDVMCDGVNTKTLEGAHYGEVFPIPLTPSLLEAAGFVKKDAITYFDCYVNGHIKILDNDGRFKWKTPELPAVELLYLHQLQNLTSALGHELTIQL